MPGSGAPSRARREVSAGGVVFLKRDAAFNPQLFLGVEAGQVAS